MCSLLVEFIELYLARRADNLAGWHICIPGVCEAAMADSRRSSPVMFDVYWQRWALIAVFCLTNAVNAMLWVSYAAISQREGLTTTGHASILLKWTCTQM